MISVIFTCLGKDKGFDPISVCKAYIFIGPKVKTLIVSQEKLGNYIAKKSWHLVNLLLTKGRNSIITNKHLFSRLLTEQLFIVTYQRWSRHWGYSSK